MDWCLWLLIKQFLKVRGLKSAINGPFYFGLDYNNHLELRIKFLWCICHKYCNSKNPKK
jgi:hypothetical protein